MAAKRRKSSKCPEPINTLLDLAGAATLGLYVRHKVKKDFESGCGEESAKAAAMVFGMGSMRRGSQGMINLGGLIGLNSALKEIEKQQEYTTDDYQKQPYISPIGPPTPAIKKPVKSGVWREHCEDGTTYGIYPEDFDNADDYAEALETARNANDESTFSPFESQLDMKEQVQKSSKYRWRKYCEDGSRYGVYPDDYETADDYEDALTEAKKNGDF